MIGCRPRMHMVRIACIVNPAGRDGTVKKRWPKIAEQIASEGLDCEIHWTERTGHASEIAYSLRNRDDLDLVVAVGGDGTMLKAAHLIGNSKIPITGINTGRLGFLSNISKDHIKELHIYHQK